MMRRFLSKHIDTIRFWLMHRHLPIILACVGIVLTLPALGTGWVFDDYWHKTMFLGQWPRVTDDASLIGMFSFMDGTPEGAQALKEAGIAPWWTFEGIKMAFWRPLAELTHWVDYQLWPETPWLMHAHSLIWFGVTIWVVAKLYRRIIGPVWVAGLAGLLFAFDNTHALPAGFIANRNTVIAACFGGLALLAHIRWSQDKWRAGIVWGPLCYLLGLLAKESALAIGAYLFAYTLLLDQSRVRRKILGFLPYVAITLGWFLTYRSLGFGLQGLGIDLYIDPGKVPLAFVKELFVRMPILLLAQFTGSPAEGWGAVYTLLLYGKVIVGCVAVVVLPLIALSLFPLFRRDAVSRFWLVGALLGLVPVCAAFPSSRLLFFAGIGCMAIIARFLASWFEQSDWLPNVVELSVGSRAFCPFGGGGQDVRDPKLPDWLLWKRSARLLGIFFIVIHLILSPLALALYTTGLGVAHYLIRRDASSMPYDEDISQKSIVFVNPPSQVLGAYISQVRAAHGETVPAHIWTLASGNLPFTVSRFNDYSIDTEFKQGLLETLLGHVLRGPSHPMQVGQQVVLSGMSIEVLALADNWQPSRVRFTFAVPLDDPSLLMLRWDEKKGIVPYIPPIIGESEILLKKVSLLTKLWKERNYHEK